MSTPQPPNQTPGQASQHAGTPGQSKEAGVYLRTRVMTASPTELRLLLLDGAVKFAMQAKDGLGRKDFEAVFNGVTNCRNIVIELMTSVREDVDPKLAEKVKALYAFIVTELSSASMEKSVEKFGKVVELLKYERETWAMLME
ncbi:MAG: flagellar export chaperone FliS [Planctomycetota bacterium]